MKRNFLLSAFLSTVLLSTSLFSQNLPCVGGHCKIDLKKLFPSKNVAVKTTHFRENSSIQISHMDSELIALDSEKYLMQEHETLVLEGNEDVIVLAHSKYIAKANEKLEAMQEEPSILAEPIQKIEDTIMNKSLPASNYYCANEKKVVYHQDSDSYECA